jgi:hypothetical protein
VNEKEITMRLLRTRASRPEDHYRSRGRLGLVVGVAVLAAVVTAGASAVTGSNTIPTIVGTRTRGFSGDSGLATSAQLSSPTGLAVDGILISVSCTSAHACMAVGTYDTSGPGARGHTLAEAWNGKTWTIIPTPNPRSSLGNNLFGVSCGSAHACMAVGEHQIPHGGVPLAEAWNGKTWTVKTTPKPDNDSGLDSVSCSSANACIATGFAIQNNRNNWFSEAWNGKTWTIKAAPRPNGTTFSSVDGVSCPSARVCVAAGDYELHNSSNSLTLAEAWNGRSWRIKPTPNPTHGVNGSRLSGVSCSAANACMAVGGYNEPSNQGGLALAERWNGMTWAITTSRSQTNSASSTLEGVSCRSAHNCVAVGSYIMASSSLDLTLAEMWNGQTWTIENTPTPDGATGTTLDSVSCGSAHACVAVGDYTTDPQAPGVPLSEVWNGQTWTIKAAPF